MAWNGGHDRLCKIALGVNNDGPPSRVLVHAREQPRQIALDNEGLPSPDGPDQECSSSQLQPIGSSYGPPRHRQGETTVEPKNNCRTIGPFEAISQRAGFQMGLTVKLIEGGLSDEDTAQRPRIPAICK